VIEKIETPSVVEVDVCGFYILCTFHGIIDTLLRISRQPSVVQMASVQQEDTMAFDSL
jgi:hypothetical protein